jgi:prophage regulatory protein
MKLLTFKQLGPEKGIPYSRDHWRRKCRAGEAPTPVPISDRRVAWIESEIDEWLASRAAARDTARETAGRSLSPGSDAAAAEPTALSAAPPDSAP